MKNEKGFTLIELMVVVAIIGILTAIAIPNYTAYKKAAILATQVVDVTNIRLSVELFYLENGYHAKKVSELKGYGFSSLSGNNFISLLTDKEKNNEKYKAFQPPEKKNQPNNPFVSNDNYNQYIKVTVSNLITDKDAIYESEVGIYTSPCKID